MADAKMRVGVEYEIDSKSLQQIQTSLQKTLDFVETKRSKNGGLTKDYEDAAVAATKLQNILNNSFNKDLGTVNMARFNSELKASGMTVNQLQSSLAKAGQHGQLAFDKMASSILGVQQKVIKTESALTKMAESLGNTIRWSLSSSIVNGFTTQVSKAISYVKNLDSSLNNIRIVTGASADEMERFAGIANSAAKGLGATTLDYTNASLIYYQQGKH